MRLHFHFSLSCIGEGNGNPLQCSYLENPRDREAWWADVYGVTQSRTRLKQLSSNSSSRKFEVKGSEMKVTQLCPTLCNPTDHTVHGILQARIPDWVAFPFSRGSSQPRDRTQVSCIAGGFFISWATREAQQINILLLTNKQMSPGGRGQGKSLNTASPALFKHF